MSEGWKVEPENKHPDHRVGVYGCVPEGLCGVVRRMDLVPALALMAA